MEITNDSQAEKHRLQALVKLVGDLKDPDQSEIFRLLQPWEQAGPSDAYSSARTTFNVAKDCQLVSIDEDQVVKGLVRSALAEHTPAFQNYMVHALLGATDDEQSHYRFNLFSAWYAVQDERVLFELAGNYDVYFNQQVFPDEPVRQFNSTKFAAWRKWAVFLGLGWLMRQGNREVLVPDATRRLQPMLPEIFGAQDALGFAQFMERLARFCPELDGGILYTICWQASRGGEVKGNRLSLMLSTALRTLDGLKQIRLLDQADALETWQLYPAEGHRHKRVTHIEYGGGK